jgi:hypothetical protein
VTVRSLSALVMVAGLCLTNSVPAKEPVRPKVPQTGKTEQPSSNQLLADAVAARLRASGVAAGADVHIATQQGVVQLSGRVRSTQQMETILQTALYVPGVKHVEHTLKLMTGLEVMRTAGAEPAPLPPGAAVPTTDPVPLAPPATPVYDPYGPRLPPYSWPTYAPYNNFSRVGYPEAYPYNAFPFIGPYYPFPKVPLGWRSVRLEWEDGHWWYGRLATPHDYWRVRFW